jgi:hypothetical protein
MNLRPYWKVGPDLVSTLVTIDDESAPHSYSRPNRESYSRARHQYFDRNVPISRRKPIQLRLRSPFTQFAVQIQSLLSHSGPREEMSETWGQKNKNPDLE